MPGLPLIPGRLNSNEAVLKLIAAEQEGSMRLRLGGNATPTATKAGGQKHRPGLKLTPITGKNTGGNTLNIPLKITKDAGLPAKGPKTPQNETG